MKRVSLLILAFFLLIVTPGHAGFLDSIRQGIGISKKGSLDDNTIVSGLKEALSLGTETAVKAVSQTDGYFGNKVIKILMPEKMQKVADILGNVGYQQQVDDFILSMNRAAEKAAPQAAALFVDAIKQMTLEDARGILKGGDTAATDYFQEKTTDALYDAFKPIIATSMSEVGVTRSFKELTAKYTSLPFMEAVAFDLDDYVTDKAMDGLFYMIGQQEKKIRTNPAARATELLKKVFGS